MRLNAFLARAGVASRRGADALIKAGRVTINGHKGELNTKVRDNDQVRLDHKPLSAQNLRYIILNKPVGYITTLKDEEHRPKVVDLIKISERVVPVGRLDFNTSGALLLTNDGELANKLAHPSFEVDKTYEATISGQITIDILNKLSSGIELEDGLTAPAKVKQLSEDKLELTIHEGRNRQVRRMLSAVGLKTLKLHRSKYGPLGLADLKPGHYRELSPAELLKLKS